ncbi:MAG: hypothetical protein JXO44_13530 [Clostridia bacterium]|nr:hypothetical protein [Clostridia bacterium]
MGICVAMAKATTNKPNEVTVFIAAIEALIKVVVKRIPFLNPILYHISVYLLVLFGSYYPIYYKDFH